MIDLIIWILVGLTALCALVALWCAFDTYRIGREMERWARYREEQGIEPDYSLEDEDA